jgi:Xaa-Pro aminopeptidase
LNAGGTLRNEYGADLGEEFDQGIVLKPGMVLVIEPVIWEIEEGGYRSEEVIAVTESGHERLTNYPYSPYVP